MRWHRGCIGSAAECLVADGAIRRVVIACAAYHGVRARQRDEGILEVLEADRAAAVHAHSAACLVWPTHVRRQVVRGPRAGGPPFLRAAAGCGHQCGRSYSGERGGRGTCGGTHARSALGRHMSLREWLGQRSRCAPTGFHDACLSQRASVVGVGNAASTPTRRCAKRR